MKRAFTLAEVLITLGIIGVVAALTMPTVINQTKNVVTLNRLKKAYSVLSQAIQKTLETDGFDAIPFSDSSNPSIENWYQEMFGNNIKVLKYCVEEAGCWNDGTMNMNGTETYSNRGPIGLGGNCLTFMTPDGYMFALDGWGASSIKDNFGVKTFKDGLTIHIDVNGNQKPNTIGKDVFVYVYTMENGLVAAGRDLSDEAINTNCSKNNNGIFCSEKIIRDGWQMNY